MSKHTPKPSTSLILSLCFGLSLSAHAELTDHSTTTKRTISPVVSPYDLPAVKSYPPSPKTAELTALYQANYDDKGGLLIANEAALQRMDFDTIKTQAKKGNKDAQFYLAKMYDLGIHTDKDMKQAQAWYQKSADNGNTHALNNLAALTHQQWTINPTTQTYTQLIDLLKKAAEQNNPVAMTNLGRHYILQDKEQEGIALLKQAGELGYAPAYYQLYDKLAMGLVSDELAASEMERVFGYLGRAADMGYSLAIREKEDLIASSLVISNLVMTRNQYEGGRIMVSDIANYQAAKLSCLDGTEPACQTIKTISDLYRKDTPTTNPCDNESGNESSKVCQDHAARQYVKKILNKIDGIPSADTH